MSVIVPDRDAVAERGASAALPSPAQSDPETQAVLRGIEATAVSRRAASENVTWLTSIDCKVTDVTAGPAESAPASDGDMPGSINRSSANWSGYQYVGLDPDYVYYRVASMVWQVPTPSNPAVATSRHVSIWPGLGTGDSVNDLLLQGGTESFEGPVGASGTYGWFEAYPLQPSEVMINNLPINGGDEVGMTVAYYGTFNAFFELCNYTTDVCGQAELDVPPAQGGILSDRVEWIVERSAAAGNYSELLNFGTEQIDSAEAYEEYGSGVSYISFPAGAVPLGGTSTYDRITMKSCDGGTSLTGAPSANAADGGFTVAWQNYGSIESC